jgi:hypothetical protein
VATALEGEDGDPIPEKIPNSMRIWSEDVLNNAVGDSALPLGSQLLVTAALISR